MNTEMEAVASQLETHSLSLANQARMLVVCDQPSFLRAAELRKAIKLYLVRVGEVLDPVIHATHLSHKTAVAQKRKLEAPALRADEILEGNMVRHRQEQEGRRREAEEIARRIQERLGAEARAVAEAERLRLEAEAEEAVVGAAMEAEARGDVEGATRLLAQPPPPIVVAPVPVFVPPVEIEIPKAEGIGFRDNWSAEVVDLMALVVAVASRTVPLNVLQADMKTLNQMARALKGNLNLPGVRPVVERGSSVKV